MNKSYAAGLALAGLSFALAPASASAANQWAEAETDHLVIYSEKSPEEAKRLATELERFDEAMRFMLRIGGKDKNLPRSAKLTVFQFGDTDDIGRLAGAQGVYGFFIPRAGDSVAFVPVEEAVDRRDREARMDTRAGLSPRKVMYHEYAHYFMYQHAAAAYPAWYREGFAEVYGTLMLTDGGFIFGAPATHRALTLDYLSMFPVKRMLDPPKDATLIDTDLQYSVGWLLSHYLTFSPDRKDQLDKYFKLINEGKSNREAAEGAFGDLDKLNRELDSYKRKKVYGLTITYSDYTPPEPKVRTLSDAEAEIMSLRIKSARGVDEKGAASLLSPVRAIAARYPSSVPVQLELSEAEFDAKNYAQAEAAARKVLELDAANSRAHIFLARIAKQRAKEDPAQFAVMRHEYAAANKLDGRNPDPLLGYYLSYRLAGETPPEDALIGLEQAYDYAPFDRDVRTTLAHLLLTENRNREAAIVLGPIAADPHGGKFSEKITALVEKIKAGDTEEAKAELMPKLEEPKEDEE